MIQPFLRIILISFILFASVTLISYFITRDQFSGFKLGYPFVFYEQFQLRGNNFMNFGWNAKNAIYNYLIASGITLVCLRLRKETSPR